jgi:histone H3/H4
MDGRGAAAAVHPSPGAAEGLGPDVAERVHYTVGCIATHEASEAGNTISRQGVQAITQCLVNWTCGVHAVDIEAFARHRGSHSVAPKDVKLALRRLGAEEHLEQHEASLTDS